MFFSNRGCLIKEGRDYYGDYSACYYGGVLPLSFLFLFQLFQLIILCIASIAIVLVIIIITFISNIIISL